MVESNNIYFLALNKDMTNCLLCVVPTVLCLITLQCLGFDRV